MSNSFIGMYLKPSTWAKEEPDWQLLRDLNISLKGMMSEKVFDNGVLGVSMCRDGFIQINLKSLSNLFAELYLKEASKKDFELKNSFTSFCLDYINTVLVLLDSEFIKDSKISIFSVEKQKDPYILTMIDQDLREGGRIGYDNLGYYRQHFQKRSIQPNLDCIIDLENGDSARHKAWVEQLIYHDFEKHDRIIISSKVFHRMLLNLEEASKNKDIISLLSILVSAIDNYKHRLFAEALISSWSIIEYFINIEWEGVIKSLQNDGRLGKLRKDMLTGRDYTASIKSNIIEMNGRLEYELFQNINDVRKARNKIAHDFAYSNYDNTVGESQKLIEICNKSFESIKYFFAIHYKIDLVVGTGLSGIFISPS